MKNPLVVGYKGEIGSFILQGLLRTMPKALNIWCFDINEAEHEKIARINRSDVIFLCVPIQNTVDWLAKYQKYLQDKIVIEQTSVKSILFESRRFAISYYTLLSMHILFRPSATFNKNDREIALVDCTAWKKSKLLKTILKITDCSNHCFYHDYKNHDTTMALQQTLIHRALLVIEKMLDNQINLTYNSKRVLELAKRIRKGDPVLYKIIQESKYGEKTLKDFQNKFKNFDIEEYMK